MPLIRRMPKRGFTNSQFRRVFALVNVKTLELCCEKGAEVDARSLSESGAVRDAKLPLKILGEGELTKKLTVTAAKFSASAKAKIEAAGGTVVEVPLKKWRRSTAASNTKTSTAKKTKYTDAPGILQHLPNSRSSQPSVLHIGHVGDLSDRVLDPAAGC